MIPDYDRAAIAAIRVLIDNQITETPVAPLPILLRWPGVRVISFARMANEANMERDKLIPLFVANQDAATFRMGLDMDGVRYVTVYNQRLPFEIIWRGIARELGHIVLDHDGLTRPYEVRRAEAMCFAHHLLSPRPILRMLQEAGFPLTMNVLSDTTGCIDECVEDMQAVPGTHVPAELNREVKKLFSRRIGEYIRFHAASAKRDHSPVINLGTFMDGYEE